MVNTLERKYCESGMVFCGFQNWYTTNQCASHLCTIKSAMRNILIDFQPSGLNEQLPCPHMPPAASRIGTLGKLGAFHPVHHASSHSCSSSNSVDTQLLMLKP